MGIPVLIPPPSVSDVYLDLAPMEQTPEMGEATLLLDTIMNVSPLVMNLTEEFSCIISVIIHTAMEVCGYAIPFDDVCIYREILSLCRETSPVCADPLTPAFAGSLSKVLWEAFEKQLDGAHTSTYYDLIYNQIWLVPVEIDLDIITSEQNITVYCWNAYLVEHTLSEIVLRQLYDESYSPAPNNEVYTPTHESTYTLHIPIEGEPYVRGYGDFKFDIGTFSQLVTFSRALPFPALPDNEGPQVGYKFLTVKVTREDLKEQRRPVDCKMRRSYTIQLHARTLKRLEQYLAYADGRFLAIPLANEPFEAETITSGATTITFKRSTSDSFDIHRTPYIFILDPVAWTWEVKQVDSVSDTVITTTAGVVGSYTKPVVFPCIIAYWTKAEWSAPVDGVELYELGFEEYVKDDS